MNNIYLFLLIFLLLILINFFYNKNQIENFGNFSPYLGNNYNLNTYAKFKRNDERMLEKERYRWEKPFNCYNEGYYNAGFKPPYVHISSYVEMKNRRFKN